MSVLSNVNSRPSGQTATLSAVRPRTPQLNRFGFLAVVVVAVLSVAGCGPGTDIQEYVVPAESERIITSDVLKDDFGVIPFKWDAPDSWTLADNDQFSKVAWTAGPKTDPARITLSDLPLAAGLEPQLVRWRGQIDMEPGPGDDPMAGTEELKLGGVTATFVDFKGPEATILGLLVPQADKLWIFKFRGSNAVADQQRETFRRFCESVTVP